MNQVSSGDEKLLAVSQQIDDVMANISTEIRCPYCTRVTAVGENFCCGTMMRAANALMDARDRFRPSLRS